MGPLSAYPWELQALAVGVLCAVQFGCWWVAVRLVNWSTRANVRAQIQKISTDPLATAVYRAAVVFSCAYIITGAWSRFIG